MSLKFGIPLAAAAFATLLIAGGCGSGMPAGGGDQNPDGDGVISIPGLGDPSGTPGRDADDPDPFVPPASPLPNVLVRFANASSSSAVQVEFYTAEIDAQEIASNLFQGENRRTANVGVGGTGWIPPLSIDSIELPCSSDTAIGTLGGEFAENDSGTAMGRGAPRWLSQQSTGFCGQVVTFYYLDEGGSPATRVTVEGTDSFTPNTP